MDRAATTQEIRKIVNLTAEYIPLEIKEKLSLIDLPQAGREGIEKFFSFEKVPDYLEYELWSRAYYLVKHLMRYFDCQERVAIDPPPLLYPYLRRRLREKDFVVMGYLRNTKGGIIGVGKDEE